MKIILDSIITCQSSSYIYLTVIIQLTHNLKLTISVNTKYTHFMVLYYILFLRSRSSISLHNICIVYNIMMAIVLKRFDSMFTVHFE